MLVFIMTLFAGCTQQTNTTKEDIHGNELRQSLVTQYCTPISTDENITVLGYLEERDDIASRTDAALQWYAFIIYKVTDLTKSIDNFEIRIRSNWLTGTSFSIAKANELAAEANESNSNYSTWGAPYVPTGDLDPKRVEYRLYQVDGKPTAVEVYVVMRNADHTAKDPKTLRVDWPTT